MQEMLQYLMQNSDEQLKKQIQYILNQLNSVDGATGSAGEPNAADNGGDDDHEEDNEEEDYDDDYGDEDEDIADDADEDPMEDEVDIMDEDIDKLHDQMK